VKELRELFSLDIDIISEEESIEHIKLKISEHLPDRKTNRLLNLMGEKFCGDSTTSLGIKKKCRFYFDRRPSKIERTSNGSSNLYFANMKHTMKTDLIITCTGYQKTNDFSAHESPAIFYSGWASFGASGTLAATLNDATCTAQRIVEFIQNKHEHRLTKSLFEQYLKDRSVKFISWPSARTVLRIENEEGRARKKVAEKICDSISIKKICEYNKT